MQSSSLLLKKSFLLCSEDQVDQSRKVVESLLECERMVLQKIATHENSLYLAVAKAMWYQQNDFDKLYYKACNYLQKAILRNVRGLVYRQELNDKLAIFRDNIFNFRDYCYNPNKQIYEKVLQSQLDKHRTALPVEPNGNTHLPRQCTAEPAGNHLQQQVLKPPQTVQVGRRTL